MGRHLSFLMALCIGSSHGLTASGGDGTESTIVKVIHCASSTAKQEDISIGPYTVEFETEEGVIPVNCFARDLDLIREAVIENYNPNIWGRKGWTSLPYHLFFNGFVHPRDPLSHQQLNYSQCDPGTDAVILRYNENLGEIACSTTRADLNYLRSLESPGFSQIVKAYVEKLDRF